MRKTIKSALILTLALMSSAAMAKPWAVYTIANKTGHTIYVREAASSCVVGHDKYIKVRGNLNYADYKRMDRNEIGVPNNGAFTIKFNWDRDECQNSAALYISIFNDYKFKVMDQVMLQIRKKHEKKGKRDVAVVMDSASGSQKHDKIDVKHDSQGGYSITKQISTLRVPDSGIMTYTGVLT